MNTLTDSKLVAIIRENLDVDRQGIEMRSIDRRYWSESTGHEYLQLLATSEALESLKVSIGGHYFAICSLAAVGRP